MAEQRVPNLEEMDEQEAHRFLTELLSNLNPEAEYELRHQDYVMEMPQSGERFRGRENMRAFQEDFPSGSSPRRSGYAGCWCGTGCGSSRASSTTGAGGSCMALPYSSSRTARYGMTLATSPSPSKHQGGGRTW